MVTSGFSGDYPMTIREIRRLANEGVPLCRTSMYSESTIRGVFSRGGVSTMVRFTNLGTMNRDYRGPIRCCHGGVSSALALLRIVGGRNMGGFVFDSDTAICNAPRAIPLIRAVPGNSPAGPCN